MGRKLHHEDPDSTITFGFYFTFFICSSLHFSSEVKICGYVHLFEYVIWPHADASQRHAVRHQILKHLKPKNECHTYYKEFPTDEYMQCPIYRLTTRQGVYHKSHTNIDVKY